MNNEVDLLPPPPISGQEVRMFYQDQAIGGGIINAVGRQVTIETTYEWPPDAPAEIEGLFFFAIRNEDTCAVRASYPGLLHEPIEDNEARYTVLLIGARPQIQITTRSGARLSAYASGPFGDPERVTGYSLSIVEPEQHPLNLVFRFAR